MDSVGVEGDPPVDNSGKEPWSSGRGGVGLLAEEVEGPVSNVLRLAALISASIWLAISIDRPQKSGTKCWHLV